MGRYRRSGIQKHALAQLVVAARRLENPGGGLQRYSSLVKCTTSSSTSPPTVPTPLFMGLPAPNPSSGCAALRAINGHHVHFLLPRERAFSHNSSVFRIFFVAGNFSGPAHCVIPLEFTNLLAAFLPQTEICLEPYCLPNAIQSCGIHCPEQSSAVTYLSSPFVPPVLLGILQILA